MNRIIEYVVALSDLLMPRTCLACGRRLGMRERHLCLSCAADVPYTRFWLAPHNPLADRFNAVLERHRGTEPMDYAYAAALLYYKGAYRSIPRALKYQGNLAAGRHYGALLGRRLAAAPHFADIDLVIPVPLHWTRLRSRGYNQSEILARALVAAYSTSRLSTPGTPGVPGVPGVPDTPASGAPGTAASAPPPSGTPVKESPGPSERWPVGAGHDEDLTSSLPPVPPDTSSTVPLGGPRKLPEVRTDLLVRARRTRTQTRVSVDQKARNVASAFKVPERFSFWHRVIAQWSCLVSFLSARWPIGVGHDEGGPSGEDDPRHDGRESFRHDGWVSSRHSRLDRESPATVLASAHHILLVDDTFTTGATLYACYAAIRPFTTARISIATLAAVEGSPSTGP